MYKGPEQLFKKLTREPPPPHILRLQRHRATDVRSGGAIRMARADGTKKLVSASTSPAETGALARNLAVQFVQ